MTQPVGSAAGSEFLVDPAWLRVYQDDPDLVLIDIDGEAAYRRGHIPGAVMLPSDYERDPVSGWVSTFSPQKFAETCLSLGIGDATRVIVYDHNMSLYAARFWWVLNYYGHSNVNVLDGGWRRWVTEGGLVSFDEAVPVTGVKFTPIIDESIVGTLEDVRTACSLSDAVIWDVRTNEEYNGRTSRGGLRPGHILGAVNLDWTDLMDRETHRFRPVAEIQRLLTEQGITPDKAVFAY